jgi:hypothetical protein
MVCNITDVLSFSFPFPLSQSFIEKLHCYKDVLLLSLYMRSFVHEKLVFVYRFNLWIYLPRVTENKQLLHFWSWLTSLTMMSSSCIHLPSNTMPLFLLAE